jgi:hypothetical protein
VNTYTRHTFVAIALVATSLLSVPATYAAPRSTPTGLNASTDKAKTISFSLHNKSDVAIKLMVGETPLTVEAGKTISVKLPVGTLITAAEPSKNFKAGDVIVQVATSLNGATIAIS